MTSEVVLVDAVRTGRHVSGAVALSRNTTRVGASIERKQWTDRGSEDVIRLAIELSDDGVRWTEIGAVGAGFATTMTKTGVPRTETFFHCRIPRTLVGTDLQARVVIQAHAQIEGAISLLTEDSL